MEDRYSRQTRFSRLSESGQEKLGASRAVIVGCGALGCVNADLLVRAGVGEVIIIDRDFVEFSNLQRQTLFDESDAADALPKAEAAARRLRAVNSDVRVRGIVDDLTPSNAEELLAGADAIVDATDNFETRYLINDFAVRQRVSWVYGAAVGSYGITMPILPHHSCCLRCVYPQPPRGDQPTCETAGVLNTITAVIGSLQAAAAQQILSGFEAAVRLKITTVDTWEGPLRQTPMPNRDPECPSCGARNFEWLNGERRSAISLCGRNAVQIHARGRAVDLQSLCDRLQPFGDVRMNDFALRLFAEPYELTVFPDGRAIIKGTTDAGIARGLYARFVGQ